MVGVQFHAQGAGDRRYDVLRGGEEAHRAAARRGVVVDQGEGGEDVEDAWGRLEAVRLFPF